MLRDDLDRRLRILIVDDNHICSSILKRMLKSSSNGVLDGDPVSVDSGVKALNLLRCKVFDCIFMDIDMPFLSGVETTLRIRKGKNGILEENQSVHIVACTTNGGKDAEMRYWRAGMDGIIDKPFTFDDLRDYVSLLMHEIWTAANPAKGASTATSKLILPLPDSFGSAALLPNKARYSCLAR